MNIETKIDKIRSILFHEWDPFGISENPNLADEYDSFAQKIETLLSGSVTAEVLSAYLVSTENKLHATIDENDRSKVVQALLKLK